MATQKQLKSPYLRYPLSENGVDGGRRTQGSLTEYRRGYPIVTYITVVRNGEKTLMRCMESIWRQKYPNIEYIVVDGGSTDQTLELLQKNANRIDYFLSEPDSGVYAAMNKGLSLAYGDFICFLNCDDEAAPDAAQTAVTCYKKTGAWLIAGRRKLRLNNGEIVKEENYPRFVYSGSIFRHNRIWHQSLYVHKNAFCKVGGLPEEYPIIGDLIWSQKCVDAGIPICLTEKILSVYSWGGISSRMTEQLQEEMAQRIQHAFPCFSHKDARRSYQWLEAGTFWERTRWWKLLYMILRYGYYPQMLQEFILAVLTAEADELFWLLYRNGASFKNISAKDMDLFIEWLQERGEDRSSICWKTVFFSLFLKRRLDKNYQRIRG